MKTIEKIYATVMIVVIVVSITLITSAYRYGVEVGGYEGYSVGYDDGILDGQMKGIESHRDTANYMLKWSAETGNYFEKEIEDNRYRVTVELVEQ